MALGAHIARLIQEGALFWRPQEAAKRLAVPTGPVRTRGAQDCHQDPPAGIRGRGGRSSLTAGVRTRGAQDCHSPAGMMHEERVL